MKEFKKAGIFDDVLKTGFKNSIGVSWRTADGETLAHLGGGPPDQFSIHLGQPELAAIILEHLKKYNHAKVIFNTRVTHTEQNGGKVWSHLEQGPEKKLVRHESRYLVGADGGKSTVRRSAGIQWEGFTWDNFRFIAANIIYNLESLSNWPPANFVVDPENWAVIAKTGKGDIWRVASGERMMKGVENDKWDKDAAVARLRERFKKILPGPTEEIEIVSVAPYVVHQRCATRFVDGNILLAGDAAHVGASLCIAHHFRDLTDNIFRQLNNPVGGLGLTTGLLDAAHVGRVLKQIIVDGASETLLESYNEARRSAFLEYTNPISIANFERLKSIELDVVKKRGQFFEKIKKPDMSFLNDLMNDEMSISSTRD